MLNIIDDEYYFDLEEIESLCRIMVDIPSGETEQQISLVKFEVLKLMLEVIMTERQEMDDNLGIVKEDELSIPFKFAFNTLLSHNIIKNH